MIATDTMLAIFCSCYLIAKLSYQGQLSYYEHSSPQYPYQGLLIDFSILIGRRCLNEVLPLRHPTSKARLLSQLQAHGLET